ncbi:MAG: acyltransferase family protein [Pseudomonadota bacterium]
MSELLGLQSDKAADRPAHAVMSGASYRAEIDGARAIAVLLVVFHHIYPTALPNGYIGVDIFFAISGFVITKSLVETGQGLSRSQAIKQFYTRRIKRIFPLVLVVFVVSFLAISLIREDTRFDLEIGLLALIGMANIGLYFNELDYWGLSDAKNIFLHTWSLGIEEQFYLLYPLILLSLPRQRPATAIVVLGALTAISLGLFFALGVSGSPQNYYNPALRAWELLLGCMLFLLSRNGGVFAAKKTVVLLSIGLLIALSAQNGISRETTIFYAVFIIAVILYFSHDQDKKSVLSNGILNWIGKRSFSIYMWHWPLIVILEEVFGRGSDAIIMAVPITLGLSDLSYRFVENAFRFRPMNSFGTRAFFAGSLSASAILAMFLHDANRLYTGTAAEFRSLQASQVARQIECPAGLAKGDTVRILGNSHAKSFSVVFRPLSNLCKFDVQVPRGRVGNTREWDLIPFGQGLDKQEIDDLFLDDSLKLLVLASRFRYLYETPYLNGKGTVWFDHRAEKLRMGYGLALFLEELDYLIDQAGAHDVKILFVFPSIESDVPIEPFGSRCFKQWYQVAVPADCNVKTAKSWLRSRFSENFYREIEQRAVNGDDFFVFESIPILCPGKRLCRRQLNGFNLLNDTNHMSKNAAFMLTPVLNDFLVENF